MILGLYYTRFDKSALENHRSHVLLKNEFKFKQNIISRTQNFEIFPCYDIVNIKSFNIKI